MSVPNFEPIAVEIRDGSLWVTLRDNRIIQAPLSQIDWLRNATPDQQQDYMLGYSFVFWDDLDDGFDTEEMTRMFAVIEPDPAPKTIP